MTRTPIIELRDITIAFNEHTVLSNFNCAINHGEHIAIMGPSGSGKSSLISAILAITAPIAGEILYRGNLLDNKLLQHLYTQLSWIPQHLDFPYDTVEEIFTNIYNLKANSHMKYSRSEACKVLERVGLHGEVLDKSPSQLSGGERQRAAIASAVMIKRPLLILDEPTSALDAISRTKVAQLLASLSDTTIIVVTHDKDLASSMHRTITL